jgi:hypothetical protein
LPLLMPSPKVKSESIQPIVFSSKIFVCDICSV